MDDLRLFAVQRAVVEPWAVVGPASCAKAVEARVDEVATAVGDETLVLRDCRMLGDAMALAGWIEAR